MASPSPSARRPLPPRPVPRPLGRPDPSGHRVALAFGGIAAASALATAFLAPATSASPGVQTVAAAAEVAPVQHVTRYVTLLPGQTPPPNAAVAPAPVATPRVVVVTTRQSGTKP